jgi:hypothetical protein
MPMPCLVKHNISGRLQMRILALTGLLVETYQVLDPLSRKLGVKIGEP